MEIKASMGRYTVYASEYLKLDSDVLSGGGTDETEILQSILDKAPEWGSLHLIMDGAALIRGIEVHSNTTIECINSSCGFFLKAGSDDAVIKNHDISETEIKNVNITLKGGTYNQNCLNQGMTPPTEKQLPKGLGCSEMLTCMRFFGVRNLVMDGVTICDQKRYALLMGNWENVYMNNINIPLPHIVKETNQDGLHFHGPGQNLRLKNIYGRGGDDFIAINTDEGDNVSSIRDVLIDGVILHDGAHQAIRLLCRDKGVLENVTIKNVMGSVRCCGFYINPWFNFEHPEAKGGLFKNIYIENVRLKQADNLFERIQPFIFCLGGNIRNITIKDVCAESDSDEFRLLTVREGGGYLSHVYEGMTPTHIEDLTVDGVYVTDGGLGNAKEHLIEIEGNARVDRIKLSNISAHSAKPAEALIDITDKPDVGEIKLESVYAENFSELVRGKCRKLTVKE